MTEKTFYKCRCSVCRHIWLSKVENSKRCPKCNARMIRNPRTTSSKTIKEHLTKYVEIADKEYKAMPYIEQLNIDLQDVLWKEAKRQFPDVQPLRLEKIVRNVLIEYVGKKYNLYS